jgi:hypothetical protein
VGLPADVAPHRSAKAVPLVTFISRRAVVPTKFKVQAGLIKIDNRAIGVSFRFGRRTSMWYRL